MPKVRNEVEVTPSGKSTEIQLIFPSVVRVTGAMTIIQFFVLTIRNIVQNEIYIIFVVVCIEIFLRKVWP